MTITQHGVSSPFYKGVAVINGKRLTFFGRSVMSLVRKQQEWLNTHAAQLRSQGRPALRVIQGGAGSRAFDKSTA